LVVFDPTREIIRSSGLASRPVTEDREDQLVEVMLSLLHGTELLAFAGKIILGDGPGWYWPLLLLRWF